MVRDAVITAGLAVFTVLALRRYVGDRYLVPTGSMEPVLHGDRAHGDIVFVDKTAAAGDQRRRDLVVVTHPTEPGQQLVKRIAACGDDPEACCIDIQQGDIWLGPDPQHLRLEQKDPLAARAERVAWASSRGAGPVVARLDLRAAAATATGWSLAPLAATVAEVPPMLEPRARRARRLAAQNGGRGVLPEGCLGTARPVDASYVDATGAVGTIGADVMVADCGLSLELGLVPATLELVATLELRDSAFTFRWQPASGQVALWWNGTEVARRSLPPNAAPQRFDYGLLDGRLFCCADDDPAALFVVERRPEWLDPRDLGVRAGARSLLYVGCCGPAEARLELRALHVFRDVFAWREPIAYVKGQTGSWPRIVDRGHWFLLGDSAFDSLDSRQFGAVSSRSFLGVPRWVLGPWPRARRVQP
jgi:hypothetical protein